MTNVEATESNTVDERPKNLFITSGIILTIYGVIIILENILIELDIFPVILGFFNHPLKTAPGE